MVSRSVSSAGSFPTIEWWPRRPVPPVPFNKRSEA